MPPSSPCAQKVAGVTQRSVSLEEGFVMPSQVRFFLTIVFCTGIPMALYPASIWKFSYPPFPFHASTPHCLLCAILGTLTLWQRCPSCPQRRAHRWPCAPHRHCAGASFSLPQKQPMFHRPFLSDALHLLYSLLPENLGSSVWDLALLIVALHAEMSRIVTGWHPHLDIRGVQLRPGLLAHHLCPLPHASLPHGTPLEIFTCKKIA